MTYADLDRVLDAANAVADAGRPAHPARDRRRNTSSTTPRKASAIRVGMSGVRLEVRAHLVTGAVSAAQNITEVRARAAACRSTT